MNARQLDTESCIRQWLEGVTYKPGWSVEYAGEFRGAHYINVHATEPNVCKPGEVFRTAPLFRVPEPREQFLNWVLETCIPGVEAHERYEWFRINGQHWRNPHAPGMPAFATEFDTS